MKQRFFQKVLLSVIIFIVIAFGILSSVTPILTKNYMMKKEARNMYREANFVAADYGISYFSQNSTLMDFQKQMEVVGRYLDCDVWIIDPQGVILFKASDRSVALHNADENFMEQIEGFDITDFGNSYSHTGDFYGYFSEDVLSVFSPITVRYTLKGYVVVHKPTEQIINTSNDVTMISYYTVLILAILIILAVLIWAFCYQRSLKQITDAATKYSKGDFSQAISMRREDELGCIARTMSYMADELNTLEDDQRKFISNVSHDFRSPLTSIKGYIEAIQDGTIPIEMQDKYLNIIIFETDRLTKLTQDLLDLNKMGHKGVRLDIADFDINQMIRTTTMTFEGICQKKGLSFDLVLTGKELFVTGDMSKIQQVLYNLIDNATKFSNNNTSIKIETNIKNEKVLISVKDHGIGIPNDSIKKIWERFYKTDLSRGKDKKGTGLGLAIVKEIIQAHGEHINVISTEGVGTEFIFTMPLSKSKEKL